MGGVHVDTAVEDSHEDMPEADSSASCIEAESSGALSVQ